MFAAIQFRIFWLLVSVSLNMYIRITCFVCVWVGACVWQVRGSFMRTRNSLPRFKRRPKTEDV